MPSRQAPSIRRVVATTLIVPVVLLTAALLLIATLAAGGVAEQLGRGALDLASARVQGELLGFLRSGERLCSLAVSQVAEAPDGGATGPGSPPTGAEVELRQRRLVELLRAFPVTSTAVIAWPDGSLIGAIRDPEGVVVLRTEEGEMIERAADPAGRAVGDPLRRYPFDPRTRPWYQSALASESAHWIPPYAFVRRGVPGFDVGTSFVRALRSASGELHCVVSIDIAFGALNDFLQTSPLAARGRLLVVDSDGELVASSRGNVAGEGGNRRSLPIEFQGLFAGREPAQSHAERVMLDGESMWSAITPLGASEGRLPASDSLPDWLVIAATPESELLSAARPVQAAVLVVSILALIAALAAALWLARRVSRPIQQLQLHVRRVGEGDFSQTLDLRAARELEELSRDLNSMSAALAERIRIKQNLELARQVQEALLPPPSLLRPGLELLGHAEPCDSAGGDSFDYIELPARDGVLIAVGDVMGHGVASAILMATARAALRSEARRTETLGAMLLRVSSVLLQSRGHGRFMTMFLLMVEPKTRRIRWANAGHEPALLYKPGDSTPVVLGGGDMPLGIDTGIVYLEYSLDEVPPGSLILSATDGIREEMDLAGNEYGDARLQATIAAHASEPLAAIRDALLADVRKHRAGAVQRDDLTFVLARVG